MGASNLRAAQNMGFTFPLVAAELESLGCSEGDDYIKGLFMNMDSLEDDSVIEVQCEGGREWLHTQGYPVEYCKAYDYNPVY